MPRMIQSQRGTVAAYFDAHHHQWDAFYDATAPDGYLFRTRLETAIDLCVRHVAIPGRALDLGCGAGPAAVRLARLGHEVVGVDLSPAMVDQARRNAVRAAVDDRCRFVAGDFASIDLPAGSFDLIVALGFIEYFDEPVNVLQRMSNLLSDSGRIVVQTPNRWRVKYLLEGRTGKRVERNWAGLRTRQYSTLEVRRLAAAAGLRRIDYRGHAFGPLKIGGRFIPGYRAARWIEHRLDDLARHRLGRGLGHVGACLISVLEKRSPATR